jgi:hypothetical protein
MYLILALTAGAGGWIAMNRNSKETILKSAILTLLMATCVAASAMAVEPPKLDLSKPIQFDVQLAPAEFVGDGDQRQFGQLVNSQPIVLGGFIEGGKLTGVYSTPMQHIHAAGYPPDNSAFDLCPYGLGGPWGFKISATEASANVDAKEFRAAMTIAFVTHENKPIAEPLAWTYRITAKPAALGYVGTYEGTVKGAAFKGACVVRARNVPCGMRDPLNALYQIYGPGDRFGWGPNYRMLIEVRGGKPVDAFMVSDDYQRFPRRGVETALAATRIHPVDASAMTIAVRDDGLLGKAAVLGGSLTLKPEAPVATTFDARNFKTLVNRVIKLDGMVVTGAGKLWDKPKDCEIGGIMSYPLTFPPAVGAMDRVKALHRGTVPPPAALLAQAEAEAGRDDVQPAPGECTRYTHRFWGHRQINGVTSFVYAPWLDFDAVAGAQRYRFEVLKFFENTSLPPEVVASFEAASPKASLAPIWNKIPAWVGLAQGHGFVVQVSALGTDGAVIGKPQTRLIVRRPPFPAGAPVMPNHAELLACALQHARWLGEHEWGSLYLTEAVVANPQSGVQPLNYPCNSSHDLLAEATADPALRDQYLRLLAVQRNRHLGTDAHGPFKAPYHYNKAFGAGVQTYFREHLNIQEILPDPAALERIRLWTRYFARLQQPSGSWPIIEGRGSLNMSGAYSLWGSHHLDNPSSPWMNYCADYRRLEGDFALRALSRAMEERAVCWFRNNTLRTGISEKMQQQTDGNDMAHSAAHQVEYLLYVLRHAPPSQRDVVMASDLLRRIEDLFILWSPTPVTMGTTNSFNEAIEAVAALSWLELYALTGDPLMKAKSEAMAMGNLRRTNPIHGNDALGYTRFFHENKPYWIVRWARRYEEVCKKPPVAIPNRHVSLTLDRLIDNTDRLELDLLVKDGRITATLARTPTWDGPGMNFHQPGRLFTRPGKALFHSVDVAGLKVGADGISGAITAQLTPPQGGPVRSVTVSINAKRHALNGWRGRWKLDQAEGRVEGLNLEDKPVAGNRQISVQIQEALAGGEAWQNWALASAMLDENGKVTAGALNNANTGWTAPTATVSACTLTDDAFAMTMEAEVAWHGMAESYRTGIATSTTPETKQCETIFKTTPDSPQALLADWMIPGQSGTEVELRLHFDLRPELGDRRRDEPLVYQSPHKPVTPGRYKFDLKGQRLGNLFYGAAEITGPDGKKATRQFLGDVETVRITSEDAAGFEATGDYFNQH